MHTESAAMILAGGFAGSAASRPVPAPYWAGGEEMRREGRYAYGRIEEGRLENPRREEVRREERMCAER